MPASHCRATPQVTAVDKLFGTRTDGLSQWDLSAAEGVAIGAEAKAIAPAVRLEAVHTGDVSAL